MSSSAENLDQDIGETDGVRPHHFVVAVDVSQTARSTADQRFQEISPEICQIIQISEVLLNDCEREECGGSPICGRGKLRRVSKRRAGSSICEHGRRRS